MTEHWEGRQASVSASTLHEVLNYCRYKSSAWVFIDMPVKTAFRMFVFAGGSGTNEWELKKDGFGLGPNMGFS